MTLTVHIGRLVLHGAPGHGMDAERLAEAIRAELGVCLASNGLPALLRSSSMQPSVPGEHRQPVATRTGIGHALYGSLDR